MTHDWVARRRALDSRSGLLFLLALLQACRAWKESGPWARPAGFLFACFAIPLILMFLMEVLAALPWGQSHGLGVLPALNVRYALAAVPPYLLFSSWRLAPPGGNSLPPRPPHQSARGLHVGRLQLLRAARYWKEDLKGAFAFLKERTDPSAGVAVFQEFAGTSSATTIGPGC